MMFSSTGTADCTNTARMKSSIPFSCEKYIQRRRTTTARGDTTAIKDSPHRSVWLDE
jgi:hypothetical protein